MFITRERLHCDRYLGAFITTPMRSTGLELQTVSAACMVEAGRLLPGDHCDLVCVGNLQPDLVLVSRSLKRIGPLDLCRPFDSLSELLAAPRQRKLRTYAPLLEALASPGGTTVIFGKRVAGADSPLGSGRPWHV